MKDPEHHKTMDFASARKFFTAMNEYGDKEDLIIRLVDVEQFGRECLQRSLILSMIHLDFIKEQLIPFLDVLAEDRFSEGVYKLQLLKILKQLYKTPFFLEYIVTFFDLMGDVKQLIWLALLLVTEDDEATEIRNNRLMKQLTDKIMAAEDCLSTEAKRILRSLKNVLGVGGSTLQQDDSQDPPGGRHDNDFPNFRSIEILPTPDEIACQEDPYLPSASSVLVSSDPSTLESRVLDRQFRLTREDMIAPVKAEILELQSKNPSKRAVRKTFSNVVCQNVTLDRNAGTCIVFSFDVPAKAKLNLSSQEHADEEKEKERLRLNKKALEKAKEFWDAYPLLKLSALVCLVREGKPIRFGIVGSRSEIVHGKIGIGSLAEINRWLASQKLAFPSQKPR